MENDGYMKRMILRLAETAEGTVAFSVYDGKQVRDITYQQFVCDILYAAEYFAEKRIIHKNIALAAPNSYDWVVAFYAIIASGNIPVLMNPDSQNEFLQWQCSKADISVICTDDAYKKVMDTITTDAECVIFDEMRAAEAMLPNAVYSPRAEETVVMIFTSGTTGKSKVVELTSRNLLYGLKNFDSVYAHIETDRILTPIPSYHVLGILHIVKTLSCCKTVCLGRGIGYLFMDMEVLNPSVLNVVPSVLESLVKLLRKTSSRPGREKYIGKNLQVITYGGAALRSSVVHTLLDQGFTLYVGYGMTEVTAGVAWCAVDKRCPETGGKFCEHVQYRFESGELLLSGPTLMKGYYKDPEETAWVIRNQWLYTGDLGYCDEEGYLYLKGRKKNTIILSNGENISPEEIEEKLREDGCILECMVYNDGKGICADIYTDDRWRAEVWVKLYNESTPRYRQIRSINYSDVPLEKTASGKIKRKENAYV